MDYALPCIVNHSDCDHRRGYMSPDNPDFDPGLPQRYEDDIARIKELVAEDEENASEPAPQPDSSTHEEGHSLDADGASGSRTISGTVTDAPQNPAPTPRPEVDKLYGWWGPCNRSANDLMRTVRRDFSKFGNYSEDAAGGLAIAGIHFDSGPITQDRVIGITVGAVSTVDPSLSYSRNVSVTVSSASTMSFTFTTNPGHFFYPGTISFSARDVTSNGASAVEFQIKAQGQLADRQAKIGFGTVGGGFEDRAWRSFLDKVRKSCGNQ